MNMRGRVRKEGSAVGSLVEARGQHLDCVFNCAPLFLKWERWDCALVEEGDA